MLNRFEPYIIALRRIVQQRWFLRAETVLAIIAVWDLFGAQFVSAKFQSSLPRVYDLIALTGGFLPWWAWGWIGTLITTAAVIEYAVRLRLQTTKPSTSSRYVVAKLCFERGVNRLVLGQNSSNVEHAEYHCDGSWTVQFLSKTDHRSLSARVLGSQQGVNISSRSPRQVKFSLASPTPLEDLLKDGPVEILFECADV